MYDIRGSEGEIEMAKIGHIVSAETRAKISATKKGHKVNYTPEWRANMSAALKGRIFTPETRAKIGAANKLRIITPETRAKISAVQKGHKGYTLGYHHTIEARAKIGAVNKGKHITPEMKVKQSAALKGQHRTPGIRANMSAAAKVRWSIPEARAKQSVAAKNISPEVQRRKFMAVNHKQTKPEKIVESLLNPKEYKYVGSDGSVILNNCLPDFFNINNEKKVIEVFGDYYHGLKHTGRTREQEEVRKFNQYVEVGFDCLIIWENETKNKSLEPIKERIKAFRKMKHFENQPYLV